MGRQGTHRPRLLVVDDYRDGAEAISIFLSLSGYDTRYVLSGAAVAAAVTACPPELALVDINMPDMDGFAVARQLRQDWRTRHIVTIAFTAQDEFAIRKDGVTAGFDAYCQKGSNPNWLLHLFNQMAGQNEA